MAEYIAKALALVAELDVPDDLRSVVFDKACNLFSTKQITMEQVPIASGGMAIPGARL